MFKADFTLQNLEAEEAGLTTVDVALTGLGQGERQVLLELEGPRGPLPRFNSGAFSSWLSHPEVSTQLGKQRGSQGDSLAPTEISHSSHQRN